MLTWARFSLKTTLVVDISPDSHKINDHGSFSAISRVRPLDPTAQRCVAYSLQRRNRTDTSVIVLACSSDLEPHHEEIITFDTDLSHYNVKKGVHTNDDQHEVYAPVAMWIEALDLILTRMQEKGFDFSRVRGVSGAGQQHGSV